MEIEDPRLVNQVARFRFGMAERGLDPKQLDRATRKYTAAHIDMNRLVDAAVEASDRLGRIRLTDRYHIQNMARTLYGRSRKAPKERWAEAFALVAGRYILEGIEQQSVLAALEACWRVLVPDTTDQETAAVVEMAQSGILMNKGGNVEEGSQKAEVKTQNLNTKTHYVKQSLMLASYGGA